MRIAHINSQSLQPKLHEIEIMLSERNIDILCVSETWLSPIVQDRFIDIPDFKMFRHDRGRGGGVCVYARDVLHVTLLNTNVPEHAQVEDIWISIQYRKHPSIIVGSLYRHPHALVDSFENISEIFKTIILKNKPIFVLRDFNDDLFHEHSKLNKIIKNVNLHQLLNKPTRITPTSSSLLDVIITNKPDMIMGSDVSPCEIADHELTSVDINIVKPKRSPVFKTFRCLTNYSPEALRDLLLAEVPTLNTILRSNDINFQVNTFTSVFQSCQDSCAPMVTKEIT